MKHLTWVAPNAFMEVLHIQTENQHIQLTVQSTHTFTHCPTCAAVSSRIHSRYTRIVQDVPFNEKSVSLLVLTRKWFCDNPRCATRIFTERLEGIQSHRRRTQRVEEVLRKIAFSTSCLTAEKIAHALHIPVSHDALLSLIYRTEFKIEVSPFCRS